MPGSRTTGPVNEQDLHIAKGAYDQVHHAHGYQWKAEPHHWYWFAGVAAACVLSVAGLVVYVMSDRGMAPLCQRSDSEIKTSPDGSRVLESVLVSCGGGEATRRVLLYDDGGSGLVAAVASFAEDAKVRARWTSDNEVVISKTGGKMWSSRLSWHDVKVHYATR